MAEYRRSHYPTNDLIDGMGDDLLLAYMGVPLSRIPEAWHIYKSQTFTPEILQWLDDLPDIYRPPVQNMVNDFPGMGLIFYGKSGTGKTTTAAALLLTVIRRKIENKDPLGLNNTWFGACMGRFIDWQTSSELFRNAVGDTDTYGEEADELKRAITPAGSALRSADFLVIDDITREKGTEFNVSLLHRILRTRYNACYPTILTANYTSDQWFAKYGEVLGTFMQRAFIPVEFKGK